MRWSAWRDLSRATYARRNAEVEWRNAVRELHDAGYSAGEIAAKTGIDESRIEAVIASTPSPYPTRDDDSPLIY